MQPYELLRLAARVMDRSLAGRLASLPVPRDEPAYRSGDEHADRFLLIGNGRCSGWGVASHQIALTGTLGRALAGTMGVGIDVDFIGGHLMRLENAVGWVGNRAQKGYRGALVMLGAGDALHLTPLPRWQRDLGRLIDHLDAQLDPGTPLFLATLPSLSKFAHALDLPFVPAFDRHAARMNEVTREIAHRVDRVVLVEDTEAGYDPRDGVRAADDYRRLGERLAIAIAPALSAAPSRPTTGFRPPSTWSGMSSVATADGDGPLMALVEEAAAGFRVWGAGVTILDGENVWIPASTVPVTPYVPRGWSFSEWTIEHNDTLVISDAAKDERVRDNPLRHEWRSQFFAGHPVRNAGGTAIGAFCISDTRSREFTELDVLRLQTFARRTELHLHALERRNDLIG